MADKKVKILLKQRVLNLGKEGDILDTSRAYAMNALIPQGKAELIDEKKLKYLEDEKKRLRLHNVDLIEKRHNISETLHMKELSFDRKGNDKKVFGGINEKDIIDEVSKKYKIKLNKNNIKLPDNHHIKKPGSHDVIIHIHDDTYIKLIINLRAI